MKIVIRHLTKSEGDLLSELLSKVKSFDKEDYDIAMELIKLSIDQPEQKDYYFILAEDEPGSIVGYACFGPTPLTEGTYDLYWIAVDPDIAGKGIGTLILKGVEDYVGDKKGRMLLIETSSRQDYGGTRHFYLKNGYKLVDTIQDFYRPGEDRVTYVKRFPITGK